MAMSLQGFQPTDQDVQCAPTRPHRPPVTLIEPAAHLEVSTTGGVRPTLVLAGELDIASVAGFETALNEVEATNPRAIVVDLRSLRFMDCSGLHSFFAAGQRIRGLGGRLLLVSGPPQVQRLFELTRTTGHFEFVAPSPAL